MATQQILVLAVFVVSNCVSSKPEDDLRIKLNVNVNIDQGQSKNESVELVTDVANPRAWALEHYTLVPPPFNVARKLKAETKDWGSCIECVRKNTVTLMRCVHLLRKASDDIKELRTIKCFRDLAKKDEGIDDEKKCATCTCKQLKEMGVNVEKYPVLHKMFCILGNQMEQSNATSRNVNKVVPDFCAKAGDICSGSMLFVVGKVVDKKCCSGYCLVQPYNIIGTLGHCVAT